MLTITSTEGGVTLTLVTNVYDSGSTSSGYGRLTSSTPLHGVATTYSYNTPGQVTTVSNVISTQLSYTSSPNEVLPTQVTVNSVVTQTLNYSSTFNLLSLVGANTETTTKTYDSNWRPDQTTIPQGAKTYNVYTTNTRKTIISSATPPSPDDGRFTKTTIDGLGRPIKVETGTEAPAPPGGGIVIYPGVNGVETVATQVDTEYDSCGCAPLGKLKRTSMPHAPGGSVIWTTYSYDGIGRTLSVVAPDGASTTVYLYEGNTTKITDAAGKWKKYTYGSLGRLIQVNEPNPAGGSHYVTTYTYDMLDHLTGVSMPRSSGTQTRTFNYTNPTTSKPGPQLRSATNPETGTVIYTYDASWRLDTVTDAKNQRKVMVYDSDSRVIQVKRGTVSGGVFTEDLKQRTEYTYGTSSPNKGRLTTITYFAGDCKNATLVTSPDLYSGNCGLATETIGHNTSGAVTSKTLQIKRTNLTGGAMTAQLQKSWTYDSEGRLRGNGTPAWGPTGSTTTGSSYSIGYDAWGRANTLTDTVNSTTLISGVSYGVANETLGVTSGNAAVYSHTMQYNSMLQLTRLTVGSVLDYEYHFSSTQNNGKIDYDKDWLTGERVDYTYDSLNRLATAQTNGAGGWGQSYTFDGFGNLTDQTVIKGSAPSMSVVYSASTNRQTGDTADANGNILGSATPSLQNVFDIDNRMTAPGGGATMRYSYDAGNKRVWRGDSATGLDEITFWGGDQRLASYSVNVSYPSTMWFTLKEISVYFGSKLVSKGTYNSGCTCADKVTLSAVAQDRLGSIGKYYPFGQERPSATANDKEKFTGYYRDAVTGPSGTLDYADQRYHQSGVGRFMSPDPYKASAGVTDPGSWNRYAYVGGDPVNYVDPRGLQQVECCGTYSEDVYGYPYNTTQYYISWWDSQWLFGGYSGFVDQSGGGGGGGGTRTETNPESKKMQEHVAVNKALHTQLSDALKNLSSDCRQALTSAGVDIDKLAKQASETVYRTTTSWGDMPMNSLSGYPSGNNMFTLVDYLGGSPAAAIMGANYVILNEVALGQSFFTMGIASQNSVLLHEALHIYFKAGDVDLARALGLGEFSPEALGVSAAEARDRASIAITAFLAPSNSTVDGQRGQACAK